MDNTTELYMTKYIIGEIFSSGGATLYKKLSYQIVLHSSEKERFSLMKMPTLASMVKMYALDY